MSKVAGLLLNIAIFVIGKNLIEKYFSEVYVYHRFCRLILLKYLA